MSRFVLVQEHQYLIGWIQGYMADEVLPFFSGDKSFAHVFETIDDAYEMWHRMSDHTVRIQAWEGVNDATNSY